MKDSHAKCLKAAICDLRENQLHRCAIEDFFIATIDGENFKADAVHGFSSFGVNMVVGVVTTERGRRYISFAADDDIVEGLSVVSLDGKVTIGYIIEEGGNVEYPVDLGGAEVNAGEGKPYTGRFVASLVQGSAYGAITQASFSVNELRNLA